MRDLIDRQAVLRKMESVMDMQELYLPIHFKEMVIDDAPTVDAVEVVRCKDCKYNPKAERRYDDDDPIFCFDWCWYMEGKDGYCCEGKRRDDGRAEA